MSAIASSWLLCTRSWQPSRLRTCATLQRTLLKVTRVAAHFYLMFLWSCAMEVSACVASAFSGYDIYKLPCAPRNSTWVMSTKAVRLSGSSSPWRAFKTATIPRGQQIKRQEWPYLSVCNHDCNRIELTKISKIQMDAHVLCLYECIFSRYRHMF